MSEIGYSKEQVEKWGNTLSKTEQFNAGVKIKPDTPLTKLPLIGKVIEEVFTIEELVARYGMSRADAEHLSAARAEQLRKEGKNAEPSVTPSKQVTF